MTAKIVPHYDSNRNTLSDVVPLDVPYSVQIEPSQYCNLSCNYCVQSFDKQSNKKQLMTMGIFSEIINQIKEFEKKLKVFNFSGWGSPLVNPLLPDMICLLKSANVTDNIAVITNGLLLGPHLSMSLVDAGVDHIRISLQGMTGKKYKEISGKYIDFEEFVDNIQFLYKNKKQCKVSIKIANIALDEFDEELFYNTFGPITDQMYVESIRPMFAENKQDGRRISKYGIEHPLVVVCPQPWFMLSVTATGDILPCCSYYDPAKFGNIKDTSLRMLWESKEMKEFQIMLLEGRKDNPVCRTCHMPDAVLTPGDELDDRADEIRGRL